MSMAAKQNTGDQKAPLSGIEEILQDIKAGVPVIIVDDEDRENEGDLVIAAEKATPENINFMAREGRGLICLPMEGAIIDRLDLPLMGRGDNARHKTAFTVSIEAKEGVTTGISAADRAHTIQTAIHPDSGPHKIATPGHIFPLRARDGGVLVRAGHTEAAVDLARMAGFSGAGVICEIMNDDGSMARLPDLALYAQKHNLKIGSIAQLIAHRRQEECLVARRYQSTFESHTGAAFQMYIYTDTLEDQEHIALVKGDIAGAGDPVLVRMHAVDIFEDILGMRSSHLHKAMEMVEQHGTGVIVLLGNGQQKPSARFVDDETHFETDGRPALHLKNYGIGAQILRDLGVRHMTLMTNNKKNVVGLDGYGLYIAGYKSIHGA